jgi:hypothetical protein
MEEWCSFDARSKGQTWPLISRLEVPRSFAKFALRLDQMFAVLGAFVAP